MFDRIYKTSCNSYQMWNPFAISWLFEMSRFLSNCSSYKCYVEFQIFSISQMEIRLIATRGFANMHSICKVARGLTKYFLFGWLHAKNAQVLRAILFFFSKLFPGWFRIGSRSIVLLFGNTLFVRFNFSVWLKCDKATDVNKTTVFYVRRFFIR